MKQRTAEVSACFRGPRASVSGDVEKEAIKISLLAEKSLRERRVMMWEDLPV
jgi:hypothetical protein